MINNSEYSKKDDLLRHETTQKLLSLKWNLLPRFIYFLNLLLYLLFLAFYSINVEIYRDPLNYSPELNKACKWLSFGFLVYFLIIEIIQIVFSFIQAEILEHLSSFKNYCEIINYPLGIATIFIDLFTTNIEVMSSLYSITILLSYYILIQKLDKFFAIGAYVNVFGKIIKKSIKIIIILIIFMIGFLLSFRNRSDYADKYYNSIGSSNGTFSQFEMTTFNGSFELTFFTMVTWMLGQVSTENMGMDNIHPENIVNYVLFSLFVFFMPILFINIFTGISIDEVKDLIEKAQAEQISTKIDYVFKFEKFKTAIQKYPFCCGLEKTIYFFENLFKKINDFFDGIKSKIKKSNYIKRCIQNKKNDANQNNAKEKSINDILIERLDDLKNKNENFENKIEKLEMKIGVIQTQISELLAHKKSKKDKKKEKKSKK